MISPFHSKAFILGISFTSLVLMHKPVFAVDKVEYVNEDEIDQLQSFLIKEGVDSPEIDSLSLSGKMKAFGIFEGGNNTIGIDTGIVLSTGMATRAEGENDDVEKVRGEFWYTPGMDSLDELVSPENTVDGAQISIKFKCPEGKRNVQIEYVFGTDEKTDCAPDCAWNDVMGIWLNRKNIALLSNNDPITVNHVESAGEFIDNLDDEYFVEADHFTRRMKASGRIGQGYNNLHIMIADTFAYQVDSWAFIAAKSFICF